MVRRPLDTFGQLGRLERTARLALAIFDMWFYLEGDAKRQKRSTLEDHYWFYVPAVEALFSACVIDTSKLVDATKNSVSIARVWKRAQAERQVPTETRNRMNVLLKELDKGKEPVTNLRNWCFAHTTMKLSRAEAFKEANLRPNQLRLFILKAIEAINTLLQEYGRPKIVDDFSSAVQKDVRRVVDALEASSTSQRRRAVAIV